MNDSPDPRSARSRVTVRDIGAAAGVSRTTVSLALRNHPKLPEATRKRIRGLAEKMGYRPDPVLSALAAYRHGTAVPAETLAWVTNWPTADAWLHDSPVYRHYFAGARQRAEELGHRLEHFWLREPGMRRSRFEQMLDARNIRALILAPQPIASAGFALTWSRYALVTLSYSTKIPTLHMIQCSHFRSMITLLAQLRRKGYRRIGCVLHPRVDARVEHLWLAAYLFDRRGTKKEDAVPPLVLAGVQKQRLKQWIVANRPEAVVTTSSSYPQVCECCEAMGLSIPADIGVAIVSNVPQGGELSGIHEHSEQIGAVAVDVLSRMLYHNERGVPKFPQRIMIDGAWVEGTTVRLQHRSRTGGDPMRAG